MNFDAEILYMILFEIAFRRFKEEGKCSSTIKDFMCDSAEFCKIITTEEDIIHIDQYPSWVFVDKVHKGIVHETLECCRGVSQAKEHNLWFVEAIRCFEGCFPLVIFFNTNIVISPSYIKSGEYSFAMKLFQDSFNLW